MTASVKTAYDALLLQYTPRPIRTRRNYRVVLAQIDTLMRAQSLTPDEEDLLELLSGLVVQYESRHFPTPDVAPGELLAHLLEVRGLSKAELARGAGIPKQTITNIIKGDRGISKSNRDKLALFFKVQKDLFVVA